MKTVDVSAGRPGPGLIAEAVGSPAELARALRVRYYRTVCPAEIGKTIDRPALVKNILYYSNVCKDNRWPVVIMRPELKRVTWGVLVMHPTRAVLARDVSPSRLVDKIYSDIISRHRSTFKSCGFIHVVDYPYHMYQGLTIGAAEILAFRMADDLSTAMDRTHA
jgi:hypothetical protein